LIRGYEKKRKMKKKIGENENGMKKRLKFIRTMKKNKPIEIGMEKNRR